MFGGINSPHKMQQSDVGEGTEMVDNYHDARHVVPWKELPHVVGLAAKGKGGWASWQFLALARCVRANMSAQSM